MQQEGILFAAIQDRFDDFGFRLLALAIQRIELRGERLRAGFVRREE